MRKILFCILIGAFLIGGLAFTSTSTAPHAFAATHISTSIPGCADSDYSCGYLHGFADGASAANNGLCYGSGYHTFAAYQMTASDQGYQDGFSHYCHT